MAQFFKALNQTVSKWRSRASGTAASVNSASRLIAPPVPLNEPERLAALKRYNILDTLPEEAFNDLTAIAAQICGTPIALMNLIDDERLWSKANVGLEVTEVPRDIAFCAHTILEPEALTVVPNTLEDERFATNPLVTADPSIRFYAGAPLVTPDGFPLGTLCVLDRQPRSLSPEQKTSLQALGRQVIAQLELRLTVDRLERQIDRHEQAEAKLRASDRQVVDLLEHMSDGFFTLDLQWRFVYVNERTTEILGRSGYALLNQVIWDLFPDLAGSQFEQEYRKAIAQRVSVSFEAFYAPLGRWFEVRAFPSYDGLSVFLLDITARRTVEEALRYQREQVEELLSSILPPKIAQQLHFGADIVADHFAEVTILFADLVNFTELASQTSPVELIRRLNQIFSMFDRITEDYGLEKIKTIGDAYMVVGGVPEPRADHAIAIAEMALAMQAAMTQFNQEQGTDFHLRIGINTGPVIAGVIGTKKPSYDLWGDAVNIASRMESQGIAGSIQVTESTYQHLHDRYRFENRGLIPVKGKGNMRTYLLQGQQPAPEAALF
jgi:adenylate cyclase